MLDKNLPNKLLKMIESDEENLVEDLAYDLGLNSKASDNFLDLATKFWSLKKAEKQGKKASCPGAVEMMRKIETGITAKDLQNWLVK